MLLIRVIALASLLLLACGKSSDNNEGDSPAKDSEQAQKGSDEPKEKESKKKADKDRGEASVMIGDTAWEAERAKARRKGSTLKIEASRTDISDGNVSRQQLTLILPDYKGAGTYQVRAAGSMFIGVGIDSDAVKEAKTDEEQTEEAVKAVKQASTIMLMQAEATVESDNGTEVAGTFSQPALGSKYPALEDGKFRAILDE